jgi:FkbM family methyltransferase
MQRPRTDQNAYDALSLQAVGAFLRATGSDSEASCRNNNARMSYSQKIRRFFEAPWPNKVHGARYHFKRAWSRVLPSVPLPVRLPYGGWWLAGDDEMGDAVFTGNFEESERRFIQGFLKPGMTVLDIGAHHGFYTVLAAKMVGPAGRVMSFEPSPRERERLLAHLRLNRILERVSVFPIALGRETAESTLYVVAGRDTGCNSLRPPAVTEPTRAVQVQVTSLDALLVEQNVPHVDFIKMDVEGAELDVLNGAEGLAEQVPASRHSCGTGRFAYLAVGI